MVGNIGFKIIDAVERYDSIKDIWETLPDLTLARMHHSSCIIGKTMYILGGIAYDLRPRIDFIEKINSDH